MSEKKELKQEELEKVSGGVPFLLDREPNANDFYFHVDDIIDWGQFIDGSLFEGKEYKVVALGKKFTGQTGPIKGYALYYKLEITDRNYSNLDGWYDLKLDIHPWNYSVVGRQLVRIYDEGIEIVA